MHVMNKKILFLSSLLLFVISFFMVNAEELPMCSDTKSSVVNWVLNIKGDRCPNSEDYTYKMNVSLESEMPCYVLRDFNPPIQNVTYPSKKLARSDINEKVNSDDYLNTLTSYLNDFFGRITCTKGNYRIDYNINENHYYCESCGLWKEDCGDHFKNYPGSITKSFDYCKPLSETTSLTVDKTKIDIGEKYQVTWSSLKAHSCDLKIIGEEKNIDGTIETNKLIFSNTNLSGTRLETGVLRGIHTITLKCAGILNAADLKLAKVGPVLLAKQVKIGDIPPKPTVKLSVEPLTIKKGESVTLSWTSENAASVSINQGIGAVRPQGSFKVSPSFTTRYTITASGEFAALGLARDSVTVRVISPEITKPPEIPIEVPPEEPILPPTEEPEKPQLDLKINGQDGPLTMQAPADFKLSWNLDQYCIAYGSWFGVKTKAGEERHTEKKAGTYNYKLYCPGVGSDSVTVKVVGIDIEKAKTGVIAPAVPMPIAEASISLDGKNFSKSIRVTRGKPVKIWLSAAHDVTGDKKASRDDTGRWTSSLSMGGSCEWNYDLNQRTPTFEAVTFDPQNPEECIIPLGELTFYDKAGIYRYGVLRLVQNDGKVSNIGYVNIAVNEPPPPDTPPIIDLRINDLEGPMVTLGAPAEYIVSWEARNADSCAASDGWKGDKFLAGSEKFVASSKRELTYTLTCVGKLGTTVKSIELKVAELPICEFSALPTTLSKSVFDRQSILSWKCQFANSCSISPEVGAGNETFGSIRVSPKTTTNYILTCQNLEGSSSFSQTVEVE
jgi:hypothetical protein